MGLFSSALSVIGTGISAYGSYKSGQDAKDVYEFNQELARLQSDYIQEASEVELAQLERDVGEFVSRHRAVVGKSGTVSNIGSNQDVIDRAYQQGDIDAGIIRWRTNRLSEMADKGANMLGTQGNQMEFAGNLNAATTLLGGLSKWDWKTSQATTKYQTPKNSYPGPKAGY